MKPEQIRKEAANLSQIIKEQQALLKEQEMRDMERSVDALNSREGSPERNPVTGTDLHLNGPSANDHYIKRSKKRRDYEGYSNTRKGKVEL